MNDKVVLHFIRVLRAASPKNLSEGLTLRSKPAPPARSGRGRAAVARYGASRVAAPQRPEWRSRRDPCRAAAEQGGHAYGACGEDIRRPILSGIMRSQEMK